jgi:hypothetical protein
MTKPIKTPKLAVLKDSLRKTGGPDGKAHILMLLNAMQNPPTGDDAESKAVRRFLDQLRNKILQR